jgi:O-antigen/teichoic acid export membrane protein
MYTAFLGPEKRSVLTFVFTTSMILTVVFTSGLSMYIRSRHREEINSLFVHSYLLLSLSAALIVSFLSTVVLLVYANGRTPLPGVLVFLCFLYSFLSTFTLSLIDCLIATGQLKFSMVFDFMLILLQFLIGSFFIVLNQTSEFVSIIVSFIASYSIASFSITTLLAFLYPIKKDQLLNGVKDLVLRSKHLYVVGIANGVVDRIDKIVIGIFLPFEILGKYALTSGVLAFGRFLPEAMAKTMLFARENQRVVYSKSKVSAKNLALLAATLLMSIVTAEIIVFFFGEEWNLPFAFTLIFAFQEFVRGFYQMSISNMLITDKDAVVASCARYLLILSIIAIPLFTVFMGIYGPSVALILVYLVMIAYLKQYEARGEKD